MREAAGIIKQKKEDLIKLWEAAVREELLASAHADRLSLRDHIPQLIDNIIQILEMYDGSTGLTDEKWYKLIYHNSIEHGRHRSSTSGYTIDQILQEYILFHRIISKVLDEEETYTSQVATVVQFSIESSMLYSASAFNISLQEMRQKLMAILAHDMRNPISAALFALEVMNYEQGKERFEKARELGRNSLKRTLAMIEDLLDSVRLEAGEGMILDFSEGNLLENVHDLFKEASEIYSNRIQLDYNGQPIKGIFDGTMIRRLLENLISNAVKYGSQETPVTISVEDRKEVVILKVHNFGDPIPPERQKKIFEFLNTTNGNGRKEIRSWGIGLTLVRAVAEAHGGSLKLESNREKGTTFSVVLQKFTNKAGKKRVRLNFS